MFPRDDLGRFHTRAAHTPSSDKYLEAFYASDSAKSYELAGREGGLATTIVQSSALRIPHGLDRTRSVGSIGSVVASPAPPPKTPSPPLFLSTTPTPTPTPTPRTASYSNGEKRWSARTRIDAFVEIECAAIVDHVVRVKRLPPFVPRYLGHDVRRSDDGRREECALRLEHVPAHRTSDGRRREPTLEAFVKDEIERARDPEGHVRRLDGVFVQILLALSGLQRHCGFVHNDLHTKNVLLVPREGTGPLVVHDASSDRRYVFEDDVPLVKIIDFGDAMVRHPETGRVVTRRWTAHLQALTNAADLRRLAVVMLRHALPFSDDMFADLVWIVDPTDGDVSSLDDLVASTNANDNVERFGFPIATFPTPSDVLARGRVARRFVDETRETRTFPRNIYHELPDDGWSSERPRAWFDARERRPLDAYAPCRPLLPVSPPELVELRDHVLTSLGRRLDVDPKVDARRERLDMEVAATYGPSADTRTRRRVAWTGLVLFQRAVVFYLKTFVSEEKTGRVDLRRGSRECARLVSRTVNEVLGTVAETVGALGTASDEERRKRRTESTRLVLRMCLVAACGGHGQFFDVANPGLSERRWFGTVARVKEAYDAAYDEGAIVAPAETLIRKAEDVETRAYADEKSRDGTGPTTRRLFEWSGDCASAYSFDHKTLEDLVATG